MLTFQNEDQGPGETILALHPAGLSLNPGTTPPEVIPEHRVCPENCRVWSSPFSANSPKKLNSKNNAQGQILLGKRVSV